MSFWTSPTGKNLSTWFQSAGDAVAAAGDAASQRMKSITEASLDNLQRPEDRVPAAHDLGITYLTQRILVMGYPAAKGQQPSRVADVAQFLNHHHGGKYMVWNFAEESYDYGLLDNQVIEYSFPGHPAPPLGLFFKITSAIESWLRADATNVVLIHCYTGRGRTSTIAACALAWLGEVESPTEALMEIARLRGMEVHAMTIPSQRRYVQYFTSMLDGVRPRADAVVLKRVIINGLPAMDRALPGVRTSGGVRPYLQLFKNGTLLYTSSWRDAEERRGMRYFLPEDGSAKFTVDVPVSGDILLRCRHLATDKRRLNVFRAAFHTGYVRESILRLTRDQLDGVDSRVLPADFFVELIFAEVDLAAGPAPPAATAADAQPSTPPRPGSVAGGGPAAGTPSVRERIVEGVAAAGREAAAYEQMLARESAFWDDVEARKAMLEKRRRAAAEAEAERQRVAEAQRRRRQEAAKAAKAAKAAEAASAARSNSVGGSGAGAGAASVLAGNGEEVVIPGDGDTDDEASSQPANRPAAAFAIGIDNDDDDDEEDGGEGAERGREMAARARARARAKAEAERAATQAAALRAAEEAEAGEGVDLLAEMAALESELGLGPLSGAVVDAHRRASEAGSGNGRAPDEQQPAASPRGTDTHAEADEPSSGADVDAGASTGAGEDGKEDSDAGAVRSDEPARSSDGADLEAMLDGEEEAEAETARKDSLDLDDLDLDDLGAFSGDEAEGGEAGDAADTLDDLDDFLAGLE